MSTMLRQRFLEIYTDWANHYLQKAGHGHCIVDLQRDVRSGVLLAEVIQSVSSESIHGIVENPAHDGEALDNIAACLTYLASKGVNVQEIQPQDILEGNLKSILTLFYGLSRLKQRSRSQINQSNQSPATANINSTSTAAANKAVLSRKLSGTTAGTTKQAAATSFQQFQSSSSSQHTTAQQFITNSHGLNQAANIPGTPQTPQHLSASAIGRLRQDVSSNQSSSANQKSEAQLSSPIHQHPLQKQQLPPTPVAQRSCSFSGGNRSQALSVSSVSGSQLVLPGASRQLSEINESEYCYGYGYGYGDLSSYSCGGSEVYQSLSGAQLWSPNKTTTASTRSILSSALPTPTSPSPSTPSKQVGRGSTPVDASLVPTYYLRALSPPPVIDHYSNSSAASESGDPSNRRDRNTSKGGISRLFGGKGDLRRKKYTASTHPLSGTVSDGEAVYSPARSLSSSHPKSPLKTALGKAFGPKSHFQHHHHVTDANSRHSINQTSSSSNSAAAKTIQKTSESEPPYQRSVSATPNSSRPFSPVSNMPAQQQSAIGQVNRRLPDQTHLPAPPTSGIPQPKSRVSPSRGPNTQTSGIPSVSGGASNVGIKSPPEIRRGIPQPSSRPKSPANVNSVSKLSKAAPSKVPQVSGSDRIPTSLPRSKSPASSAVLSTISNGEKEPGLKLKQPSNQQSSSESSTSHAAKTENQQSNPSQSSLPQAASKIAAPTQTASKMQLPQSGIKPPVSTQGKPVSRTQSQIGRLKSGIATAGPSEHKSRAAVSGLQAPKKSAIAKPSGLSSEPQSRTSTLSRRKSPRAVKSDDNVADDCSNEDSSEVHDRLNKNIESDRKEKLALELNDAIRKSDLAALSGRTQPENENSNDAEYGDCNAQNQANSQVTVQEQSESDLFYGSVESGKREKENGDEEGTSEMEIYGYATDSDLLLSTNQFCDSDTNSYGHRGPMYGHHGSGYMSEGGDAHAMDRMRNVPILPPALGGTGGEMESGMSHEQRVFRDGISAIKDCLLRSDIKLAESDSEGDVDSVTSNISDLVNDLSSDISANITSPLDRSKHNNTASNNNTTNNSNTSAHTSPANINSKTISAEGVSRSEVIPAAVQVPTTGHSMRAAKKTAIVQPQKPNRVDSRLTDMANISCEKTNEDSNMYSSSESSPQMSSNKSSNATIKRCPNQKIVQPALTGEEIKVSQNTDNSSAFSKPDAKMNADNIMNQQQQQQQQPLTGQIRGNVFRLSSVSSVVSEEHEDARSDDCQRHSGGSFQNSELVNSNESLTVLHSRNQAINSHMVPIGSPSQMITNRQNLQNLTTQRQNGSGVSTFNQQRSNVSPGKKTAAMMHAESDVEWETASMASQRSSSIMTGTNDKHCFSDTEDLSGKRDYGQANLRKMLETRAAQMQLANQQQAPRKPSAGSEYLESSFALMDIRNLRDRLANPHNIDTQSDYGSIGASATMSRSKSGRINARIDSQIENTMEKFALLNSISPGSQNSDGSRSNKQYNQLPLTQELLNKAAGSGSSISPSGVSTCSGVVNNQNSLTVDTNSNRLSAMSDCNSRIFNYSASAMNTPVLGMKHSRSGSSSGLFQAASSGQSSSHHRGVAASSSGLPPELTLNSCNPLGELASLGCSDNFFCGSNVSLNSASSFESSHFDGQNMAETIRRLKNELLMSNEKVNRLTTHIICNAQTVASFEKTLSNLNQKLSNIFPDGSETTANEIENLKNLIEELKVNQKPEVLSSSQKELREPTVSAISKRENHQRANSLDAGCFLSSETSTLETGQEGSPHLRDESEKSHCEDMGLTREQTSSPSCVLSAGNSGDKLSDKKAKKNWLRSTFKLGRKKSAHGLNNLAGGQMSSACASDAECDSPTQPSSPFHSPHVTHPFSTPSSEHSQQKILTPLHASVVATPLIESASLPRQKSSAAMSSVMDSSGKMGGTTRDGQVALRQQLVENEKRLTESKLQFLSSAHQIDQMKDEMATLKNELDLLRNENEKLANHAEGSESRCSPSASSITSSNCASSSACRHSSSESCSASDLQHSNSDLCLSLLLDHSVSPANLDSIANAAPGHPHIDPSNLRVVRVKLLIGNPCDSLEPHASAYYVGSVGITPNTQWTMVDLGVQRVFCDYMSRVDSSQLGLNADSIKCWSSGKKMVRPLGSKQNQTGSEVPTTPTNEVMSQSPFDFFKGSSESVPTSRDQTTNTSSSCSSSSSITLHLRGRGEECCDNLVFDTCVPKPHMLRYFNQWVEFKKLVFIGPPGTGKSFVAMKLTSHLLSGSDPNDSPGNPIKSLNMDLDDISDLRTTVKDLLKANDSIPKKVLFIENFHSLGSHMSEALSILANIKSTLPVFTIVTMTSRPNQSYPQLQKVFPRWVVLNNHNEPVSGLVSRFLRRKLLEFENRSGGTGGGKNHQVQQVVEWLPKVWHHVNRIIEVYNSAEVTLGPQLFMSCPMDPVETQSWFHNLWNFSLAPYLVEAIREGLQLYGAKAGTTWEDPLAFVEDTYPWTCNSSAGIAEGVKQVHAPSPSKVFPALTRIRPEDVGFDKISIRTLNPTSDHS
ncbi:neuron navigator 2-like isoform X3 [Symsagittifera roscoffensis]|uniref:neuron navigator 2-like isoform X3 n=1 Tax=Symsagittifera roscoffensis TaxID=84072 RepID=UPI00307BAE27